MSDECMPAIAAQFQSISLATLNQRAALQTRVDNKYFLPLPVFVAFAAALQRTHVMLDIDGQRAFMYDTQYFDTPSLLSYSTHVQGRRKRFKCRSRRYLDSSLCVFEIKLKGGRGETIKHKMAYNEADCASVTPEAESFLQERLAMSYGLVLKEPLSPVLLTRYHRLTLMARASMERVTCDFNLAFSMNNRWQGRMARDYVLVETKSERGRGETDQLLWRMGMRPAAGSKYCLGLSLVRPDLRGNPFHHVCKRYFVHDAQPQGERLSTRSVPATPLYGAAYTHTSLPGAIPALLE